MFLCIYWHKISSFYVQEMPRLFFQRISVGSMAGKENELLGYIIKEESDEVKSAVKTEYLKLYLVDDSVSAVNIQHIEASGRKELKRGPDAVDPLESEAAGIYIFPG